MKKLFFVIFISGFLCSCFKPKANFEVTDFDPISNFKTTNDTLLLNSDLTDAILNGVTLPSIQQTPGGYFKISFSITNLKDSSQKFAYKIFYQNESYKFNEFFKSNDSVIYNEQSGNNFYGSWENAEDSFHVTSVISNDTKAHLITDSFRIVGNPRNESKYFGAETALFQLTEELIQKGMGDIRNNPEWFKSILEKAKANKISVDDQLRRDALWIINENTQKGNFNNRWKRNPRMGNYSFLLVVAPVDQMEKLSPHLKHISKEQNGKFINPYFDLLYNKDLGPGNDIAVIKSVKVLKTKTVFEPGSGIFIDNNKYNSTKFDTSYFSENCNNRIGLFKKAQFEQFFHNVNMNYKMNNVPLIYDVTGENYSQADYLNNAKKSEKEKLISDYVKITRSPGKTVNSDKQNNLLQMKTPGYKNDFIKENVGISSRVGFTYGKFIAKIKFPNIINTENVWNGLTCAYWLKFQEASDWNNRTICDSLGYIHKGDAGPDSRRLKTTYYSEIDFEILKTSKYWPATSYKDKSKVPVDDAKSNHNIIVTCTNWDMACRDPKNFSIGATEFKFFDKSYVLHRWDDWYQALTIKHEIDHDEIFNRPFYYEIDWQPERIVWRIGSDLDKMIEVGYMDNSVSSIPDNQMVVVFSQEFHDSKWWPLSPFVQDMIPFPKNDIKCEILELFVE